ncbi:MAG: hypothetical protein HY557_05175 [Euryarchaeota archaeon]|nr:hypothetical protein [Euryarchaeota archaeon]
MDPTLLARSRTLAKIALAGAILLVGLILLLPFFIDHATVSEAFLILWGVFVLLAAIIAGVALSYVFLTRGLRGGETPMFSPPSAEGGETPRGGSQAGDASGVVQELALRLLTGDERKLYRRIVEAGGVVLQKDLVGAGLFSGSKVSRVLDRLEGKGLIQRERHGMTNRIRLSDAWRQKA